MKKPQLYSQMLLF